MSKGIVWQKLHSRNVNASGVCRLHSQERREISGRDSRNLDVRWRELGEETGNEIIIKIII